MITELGLQQTSLLLPLVGKFRSQTLRAKWLGYTALLLLYFIPAFMSTFRVCGVPWHPKGNLACKIKLKLLSDILSLRKKKDYHLRNEHIKDWLIFWKGISVHWFTDLDYIWDPRDTPGIQCELLAQPQRKKSFQQSQWKLKHAQSLQRQMKTSRILLSIHRLTQPSTKPMNYTLSLQDEY